MWVYAKYQATSLFSLKPATATASGGRTLLVPTPFAIKMAILDCVIRQSGVSQAEILMADLSSAMVALAPPQRVVVNNTFIKVLKPRRNPASPGSQDAGGFGRTITYREYAQLVDPLGIALAVADEQVAQQIAGAMVRINYLGKRGSFMQIQDLPEIAEELPDGFVVIDGRLQSFDPGASLFLQLDDTSADTRWDHVNIYTKKTLRLNKERILHHVVLPYRIVRSGRDYTWYEWVEDIRA